MSNEEQLSDSKDCAATECFCVARVWEPPNKHETTHFRMAEMGGFHIYFNTGECVPD